MNCLILLPEDFHGDGVAVIRGARARHIRDVLKKRAGDSLVAGVLNGPLGMSRIVEAGDDHVTVELPAGSVPPQSRIDLILAMPRPKVMKRLWAPLASLGIRRIVIIGEEKVEPFYFASHAVTEEIYRPRLIEGLEQARDTHLPEVMIHESFSRFAENHLAGLAAGGACLIAQPGASVNVPDALAGNDGEHVVLAVGSEGGWSEHALKVFVRHAFVPVGLGDRPLRTDVAVIALLALIRSGMA
jgi:16S rRNA (uracil1498-N3)-methyltransferase